MVFFTLYRQRPGQHSKLDARDKAPQFDTMNVGYGGQSASRTCFSLNTVEFPFKIHLRGEVLSRNILQAGCVKNKQKTTTMVKNIIFTLNLNLLRLLFINFMNENKT
jgi:hypothetical protein